MMTSSSEQPKFKRVSEEEFKRVKMLAEVLSIKQTMEVTRRSEPVVIKARKAATYEDYLELSRLERLRAAEVRRRAKSAETQPGLELRSPLSNHAPTIDSDVAQLLQNTNDLMLEVRDLIKWVSENVEIKPKGRFRF